MAKKKRPNEPTASPLATSKCAICETEHRIVDGTWVILASGHFVCATEACIRAVRGKQHDHAG